METPTHTLVQITDTHLTGGEPLFDRIDSLAQLERSLQVVVDGVPRVDALLLTGDLANDGSPDAYRRLRAVVEPVAESLGARVVYSPGNHDERAAFRAELLGEPADDIDPIDTVIDLDGLRLVQIDSTRPGEADGHLSPEQADWLRGVLATAAPDGTVVTIHHPPLPTADEIHDQYGFRDREALGAAVAGSDVRLIVAGHWHQPVSGTLCGIPVWVGASTAAITDPLAPEDRRLVVGSGISVIELYADGSVVAQAVSTVESDPVVPNY